MCLSNLKKFEYNARNMALFATLLCDYKIYLPSYITGKRFLAGMCGFYETKPVKREYGEYKLLKDLPFHQGSRKMLFLFNKP